MKWFRYSILLLFWVPLCSFLYIWDGRYFPKGVMEMRTYKRGFKKGMRETGKNGDYNLLYIQEYRSDKPLRFTEFNFGDTVRQIIYQYEGDLTKGLLTSKLEIKQKKKGRKMLRDTSWTIYHYKSFEWKPYASSTIHNNDTLYASIYQYNNTGQLTVETRTNKLGRPIKKIDYSISEYGECTRIKNFEFKADSQQYYLVDEYRIDYDYTAKKKLVGMQVFQREFGANWYLTEEYEFGKKGKFTTATEYFDRKDETTFLEYKFEQDYN